MARLLVEEDPQIKKLRPVLEEESCKMGHPFVPEEKKFVLIPTGSPSFHKESLWNELPIGELNIEEGQKATTNLPVRSRSFRGRSGDIHEIIGLILANRFVTITGVGGIGKTTVSTEVARWFYLRGYFPDGVFIIDLRGSTSSNRIVDLIGACCSQQVASIEEVSKFISKSNMLFIFDNAEDLLFKDETGAQKNINTLLKFAPNIRILATSQRQIGGNLHEPERVFRMGVMDDHDSTKLFIATSKRPISNEALESKEFHQLLKRLGGHPLSIVLMARQLAHGSTIRELITRIEVEKAKAIIVKGISDKQTEHGESLIASLSSSFNSLDSFSKELFIALSMLPAGAPDFIIKEIFGEDSWAGVHKLSDASLGEIVSNRITLFPPVRLFAESLLTLEIKERFEPKILDTMAGYAEWLYDKLPTKDGLYYRWLFFIDEPNLRFATGLRGDISKGENNLVLSDLGILAHYLMELYRLNYRITEARNLGYQIIPKLEKIGDLQSLARVLQSLGVIEKREKSTESQKNLEKALKALHQLSEVDSESGKHDEANTFLSLSRLSTQMGHLSEAKDYSAQAIKLFQELDQNIGLALALIEYGLVLVQLNDLPKAKESLESATRISHKIGAILMEAKAFEELADVLILMNELPSAKENIERALRIYQHIGNDTYVQKMREKLAKLDLSK